MRDDPTHSDDLSDADVWVTRAALLGLQIEQRHENINAKEWRYSITFDRKYNFYADWPGRVAKMAVTFMQERKNVST